MIPDWNDIAFKAITRSSTSDGARSIGNERDAGAANARQAPSTDTNAKNGHTASGSGDSTGLKENEFNLDPRFRSQVLGALAQTGKLKVVNGNYQLPEHQAALPDALQARWQKLQSALNATQPPSSGDLAKQWQVPQAQAPPQSASMPGTALSTALAIRDLPASASMV